MLEEEGTVMEETEKEKEKEKEREVPEVPLADPPVLVSNSPSEELPAT